MIPLHMSPLICLTAILKNIILQEQHFRCVSKINASQVSFYAVLEAGGLQNIINTASSYYYILVLLKCVWFQALDRIYSVAAAVIIIS